MKIAILYICTGKYKQFFKDFYSSAMDYLLTEAQKTFFIWTDEVKIAEDLINVKALYRECAGFPADSIFRFEMFLQVEEELKNYDYIYFFNSNVLFAQNIGDEILPDETGLAMGIWPGAREHQPSWMLPYERNRKSLAYIFPYGKNYVYYMGGLNGGKADQYLDMIRTLCHNIRDDYDRGIIAKFHDESHINAYMRSHACKQIGQNGFILPEEWINDNTRPKIILRNKSRIDKYFNKNRQTTFFAKIEKVCVVLVNGVRWYLKC